MLERRFSEQDSIPSAGKIVFTNVDIELTPEQQVVRASANIALGICTITLPLVHRCAGMIYTIHALTNDACIVEDQDESEDWQRRYARWNVRSGWTLQRWSKVVGDPQVHWQSIGKSEWKSER